MTQLYYLKETLLSMALTMLNLALTVLNLSLMVLSVALACRSKCRTLQFNLIGTIGALGGSENIKFAIVTMLTLILFYCIILFCCATRIYSMVCLFTRCLSCYVCYLNCYANSLFNGILF